MSKYLQASLGPVSDFALGALHTEMVLYVVRHNAFQKNCLELRLINENKNNDDDDNGPYADGDDDDYEGNTNNNNNTAAGRLDEKLSSEMMLTNTAEYTLECLGIHAGQRITERLLFREPLVKYTPLEVTRFVGSQLWRSVFGKKVDKMKHLENVYFSLTDSNFKWLRCSPVKAQTPTPQQQQQPQPGGVTSGVVPLGSTIAPGYSVDGAPLDAAAAKKELARIEALSKRELPVARDLVLYMQGVLRGVVDALLGPAGANTLITAAVGSGGTEAQFILDFRQCPRI